MARICLTLFSLTLLALWLIPVGQGNVVPNDQPLASDVPFIYKRTDLGGEACLTMVLRWLGNDIDQDFVFDHCRIDPLLGRGAVAQELAAAANSLGFKTGPVWYSTGNADAVASVWKAIQTDLDSKRPVIVVRQSQAAEQFILLLEYDRSSDSVLYHDPNRSDGNAQSVTRQGLLTQIQLKTTQPNKPTAVVIHCQGNPSGLKVDRTGFSNADYALHIRDLRRKLPGDDFHIVLQKPFVVVGDAGANQVKQTSTRTIKWAIDRLKQDYFRRDPSNILDIWLFKDAESYQRHNLQLFGSKPSTPYGYYSSRHRALVMDISTGGGTLVHEIVHPFMESNFPGCPAWFNEGLASLYEQSNSRDGHIVGLTNWRLRGLQRAIKAGRLGNFNELCHTTTREFYNGAGINYAQARYLCYYLQEQGQLVKFYRTFVDNHAKDPSGYQTLQSILGRTDMDRFQQQWEQWVQTLRYP